MVHEYWKVYEPNIGNLDFETLANNCDCGSKRRLDNGWFKYVVARLNDVCGGLSVEMCNLYLSLNDGIQSPTKTRRHCNKFHNINDGIIRDDSGT